ncbi:MAG: ribosome silencing factor [Pyrinomonadaceae bacterium]|nr:ribosome silencing factor [Pyrinomonadaceae bacterium]
MNDNSTAKERSLNPTTHSELKPIAKAGVSEELDERILGALQAASDKKALDLVVLDLREVATFTDHFVIVSGNNERQVQAISDEVFEKLKKSGTAAARVEGYKSAEWILLDYGDFIVHVFLDKARKFYDLERLWRESKRIVLPTEFGGESNSSLRDDS